MNMTSRALRRTATAVATLGLVAGGTVATAGTAEAREGDRFCRRGDVCLFWGRDLSGARSTFQMNQPFHLRYRFSDGRGAGQRVHRNVSSAFNRSPRSAVRIYRGTRYRGASQYIGPGRAANLGWWVRDNNGSHRFLRFR